MQTVALYLFYTQYVCNVRYAYDMCEHGAKTWFSSMCTFDLLFTQHVGAAHIYIYVPVFAKYLRMWNFSVLSIVHIFFF